MARRVEASREDQEKAKQQIQTTLEAFHALTGFDGGKLEKTCNKLSRELERSENRARQVSDRIRSIEKVAALVADIEESIRESDEFVAMLTE